MKVGTNNLLNLLIVLRNDYEINYGFACWRYCGMVQLELVVKGFIGEWLIMFLLQGLLVNEWFGIFSEQWKLFGSVFMSDRWVNTAWEIAVVV